MSKDRLIFTVHDEAFGSSVILEDDDLLEKWKLDKGGVITYSKGMYYVLFNMYRAVALNNTHVTLSPDT